MICKVCGKENSDQYNHCAYCGAILDKQTDSVKERCSSCGAIVKPGASFCGKCGANQTKPPMYTWVEETEEISFEETPDPDPMPVKKHPFKIILITLLALCVIAAGIAVVGDYLGWLDLDFIHFNNSIAEVDPTADINHEPDPEETDDTTDILEQVQEPIEKQILHVYCTGNRATVVLSVWDQGEWTDVLSIPACIGKNGISYNKVEGDRCTPAGVFDIQYYMAVNEAPNSKLDFRKVYPGDVWVYDSSSSKYNTFQSSGTVGDWDENLCENLYSKFTDGLSAACIVFDYNGDGVSPGKPGGGSDIFVDGVGSNGKIDNGYGDIKITDSDMYMLLSYLDSAMNPIIIIE